MYHHVARSIDHGPLFASWTEAARLWACVQRAVPGVVALVLMPNHLHLQHHGDRREQLGVALSAYARYFNLRRGRVGPLFAPSPPPSWLADLQKRRRSERYIHLNPCRARLVSDPLAWPFSTHRDACGLSLRPLRTVVPDPHAYQRWVSSDPTVRAEGTLLPLARANALSLEQVEAAVLAALRLPAHSLQHRGPARTLWLGCARALTQLPRQQVADYVGVSRRTLCRCTAPDVVALRLVERLCGDRRFGALAHGRVPGRRFEHRG